MPLTLFKTLCIYTAKVYFGCFKESSDNIRMKGIFTYLARYGQKPKFFVQKSRQK